MAGLAAMLSCFDDLDPDGGYARLAEALHPGVLGVDAFRIWLQRSPVKATRFLPMLRKHRRQRASPVQSSGLARSATQHAAAQ
jgi:hypothetical protein